MDETPKQNSDIPEEVTHILPCKAVPSLIIGASAQAINNLELKKDVAISVPTSCPQNDPSIKDPPIITALSTKEALSSSTNNRADISDRPEKPADISLESHDHAIPPNSTPEEQPREQVVHIEDVILKRELENVLRYDKSTDKLIFKGMVINSTTTMITHENILYVINPDLASEAIETLRQAASFSLDLRTNNLNCNPGGSSLPPRQNTEAPTDPGPCDPKSPLKTPTREINHPRAATIDDVPTANLSPQIRLCKLEKAAASRKSRPKSRDIYSPIEDKDTDSDEDYQPPQNKRSKAKDDFNDSKASTSGDKQSNWRCLINQRQLLSCQEAVKVLTYEAVTTTEDAWEAMDCNSVRYVVASGCYGKTSTAAFWDDFYDAIPHRARKLNSAVYANRWRRTIIKKEKTILRLLKNIGIPQCYSKFIMGYRAHEQKSHGEVPLVAKTDVHLLSKKLKCKNQLMPILGPDSDEQDDFSN